MIPLSESRQGEPCLIQLLLPSNYRQQVYVKGGKEEEKGRGRGKEKGRGEIRKGGKTEKGRIMSSRCHGKDFSVFRSVFRFC